MIELPNNFMRLVGFQTGKLIGYKMYYFWGIGVHQLDSPLTIQLDGFLYIIGDLLFTQHLEPGP